MKPGRGIGYWLSPLCIAPFYPIPPSPPHFLPLPVLTYWHQGCCWAPNTWLLTAWGSGLAAQNGVPSATTAKDLEMSELTFWQHKACIGLEAESEIFFRQGDVDGELKRYKCFSNDTVWPSFSNVPSTSTISVPYYYCCFFPGNLLCTVKFMSHRLSPFHRPPL